MKVLNTIPRRVYGGIDALLKAYGRYSRYSNRPSDPKQFEGKAHIVTPGRNYAFVDAIKAWPKEDRAWNADFSHSKGSGAWAVPPHRAEEARALLQTHFPNDDHSNAVHLPAGGGAAPAPKAEASAPAASAGPPAGMSNPQWDALAELIGNAAPAVRKALMSALPDDQRTMMEARLNPPKSQPAAPAPTNGIVPPGSILELTDEEQAARRARQEAATKEYNEKQAAKEQAKKEAAAAFDKPATHKAVSKLVAEDTYEITNENGEVLRGHWRTIHGHHAFITTDGKFYARDHRHGPLQQVQPTAWLKGMAKDKSAPTVEEHPDAITDRVNRAKRDVVDWDRDMKGRTPAQMAAEMEHTSYGNGGKFTIAGLDSKVLKAAAEAAPKRKEFDRARILAAELAAEPGKVLGKDDVDSLAKILPNLRYKRGLGQHIGNEWNRWDKPVNQHDAQIQHGKFTERHGLSASARKAEEAKAKEKEKAVVAAGKTVAQLTRIEGLLKKVAAERSSDTKVGANTVKLVAALMAAGFLREATRGATKGQLVIDANLARAISEDSSGKHKWSARKAAAVARIAQLINPQNHPWAKRDWRTGKDLTVADNANMAAKELFDKHYHTTSMSPFAGVDGGSAERNINGGQYRIPGDVRDERANAIAAAAKVYMALKAHRDGKAPEIQALMVGHVDTAAAAKGKVKAKEVVKQAGTDRDAALAAQISDKWDKPRALTMAGFGKGAKLHEYQIKGVNWACTAKKGINGFGTGLGKTLTAIATACKLKADGKVDRSVFIVPVPLMGQWKDEALLAWPSAKVVVIKGNPQERAALRKQAEKADLVIMGTSALQDSASVTWLKGQGSRTALHVDETHKYKNPNGQQYRNLKAITSNKEYAIGYSGTPNPSHAIDFFNVLEAYRPGELGTPAQAAAMDSNLTKKLKNSKTKEDRLAVMHALDQVGERSRPWVFVKSKKDPDVKFKVPPMTISREKYDAPDNWGEWSAVAGQLAEEACEHITNPYAYIRALTATAIHYERQLAISPALLHAHPSVKGGSVRDYVGPEPKIERAVDLTMAHLDDPAKAGQGVVIVCSFNSGLRRMHHALLKAGVDPGSINAYCGDDKFMREVNGAKVEKDEIKRRVNDGEVPVMLLQINSGGVGLNLNGNKTLKTGPTKMILLNQPWTESEESQVRDRIKRQGQQFESDFTVGRIDGSTEDNVRQLVAAKGAIGAALRYGSESDDVEEALDVLTSAERDSLVAKGQFGASFQRAYDKAKAEVAAGAAKRAEETAKDKALRAAATAERQAARKATAEAERKEKAAAREAAKAAGTKPAAKPKAAPKATAKPAAKPKAAPTPRTGSSSKTPKTLLDQLAGKSDAEIRRLIARVQSGGAK